MEAADHYELLESSQDTDDECSTAVPIQVAARSTSSRRIRLEIRGITRVLKWYSGTTTAELLQNVRDLAHLSPAAPFRLRDRSTGAFVELTPLLACGTTLELVEEPAASEATTEPVVPQSWTVVSSDEDPPAAVELTAQSHPELWASLCTQIECVGKLTKVVRCEDFDLWSTFLLEKRKLLKRWRARAVKEHKPEEWRCGPGCWASGDGTQLDALPNSGGVEERVLFHTANAPVAAIFEEGFDMRLAAPGNFGRGIYLSDNPRKCDAYWRGQHDDAPRDGSRVIFVAQVLLGESKIYRKGQTDQMLVREPERNDNGTTSHGPARHAFGYRTGQPNRQHSTDRYDSVQGYINVADEYIVYSNSRAYPMFAVTYKPQSRAASSNLPGVPLFGIQARQPRGLSSFRHGSSVTMPAAIQVEFKNSGRHALSIRWVQSASMPQGRETKIKPGKTVNMKTYDTHQWDVQRSKSTNSRVLRTITVDAANGQSQTIDIETGTVAGGSGILPAGSAPLVARISSGSRQLAQRMQAERDERAQFEKAVQRSALDHFMKETGELMSSRALRLLRMNGGDAAKAVSAWRREKGLSPASAASAAAAVPAAPAATTGVVTTATDRRPKSFTAVCVRPVVTELQAEDFKHFFAFAVEPPPTVHHVEIDSYRSEAFVQFASPAEARQALEKSGDSICCAGRLSHAVEVVATARTLSSPGVFPLAGAAEPRRKRARVADGDGTGTQEPEERAAQKRNGTSNVAVDLTVDDGDETNAIGGSTNECPAAELPSGVVPKRSPAQTPLGSPAVPAAACAAVLHPLQEHALEEGAKEGDELVEKATSGKDDTPRNDSARSLHVVEEREGVVDGDDGMDDLLLKRINRYAAKRRRADEGGK